MVSLRLHYGDSEGQRAIIGIMNGGEETLLSIIRLCGIEVLPSGKVVYRDIMTASLCHDTTCRDGPLYHDTIGSS